MGGYKDNQLTFQQAQRGTKEVKDLLNSLDPLGNDYGHQVKLLKQEINEAYQQIDSALEIASEHQRAQLKQYQNELHDIVHQIE
ncbi:MAG: hypothetical protein ACI35P_00265 [Bacillus sp. (in: firmicutes)]